jgi:hypothetical protein
LTLPEGINFLFTDNGGLEHANPFLALLVPSWLEGRHPGAAVALRDNEQVLITARDLFTTFHHLLHLHELPPNAPAPTPEQLAQWRVAGNVSERARWGASLLAPVPVNRTCEQAGVHAWRKCWCT